MSETNLLKNYSILSACTIQNVLASYKINLELSECTSKYLFLHNRNFSPLIRRNFLHAKCVHTETFNETLVK